VRRLSFAVLVAVSALCACASIRGVDDGLALAEGPATSVGCSPSCDKAGNTVVCDVADDGGNCPVHEAGALSCLASYPTLVGFMICK